jgi:hypothetical protein
MRHSLTKLLLSVVLVGCASEEGLQRYARGKAIEPKIVALGLPEITDKRVRVIPIGQLINDKSAVFLGSEGGYYLVSLARPLGGAQGDEVYLLDGREIVLGDSILTLTNDRKTRSQAYTNREFIGGPYERRESRAIAIFQLKDKEHVQDIANLFNR